MTPQTIHPEGWAPALGYANGMLMPDGTLHVGGQIGWDKDKVFQTHDFVEQLEQCLQNVVDIVRAAGGEPSHIGRLTWYVKNKEDYLARQRDVGAAYRRVMGKHFPAISMLVVADLIEDDAQIEIEATAFIPRA